MGLLFHWKRDAEEGWKDREGTAHKAFGALLGTLYLVPFLPFRRVVEIVRAIVAGADLYGAELWAQQGVRQGRLNLERIEGKLDPVDLFAKYPDLGSGRLARREASP